MNVTGSVPGQMFSDKALGLGLLYISYTAGSGGRARKLGPAETVTAFCYLPYFGWMAHARRIRGA